MQISFAKKILISLAIIVLISAIVSIVIVIRKIYTPNIILKNKQNGYVYIKTGATLQDVCNTLYENNFLVNRNSFEWLAEKKGYAKQIKPGKYKLISGMNNNDLINLLRSGKQERVRISFNNIRFSEQIAGVFGRHLEADSNEIASLFRNDQFLAKYGVTKESAVSIFIPNTYYFFWNTSAEDVFKRMYKESQNFWTTERLLKSKEINLIPYEVITLASIVDEESNYSPEYPIIAGVYINRLKRGMPLQADPTIKFAVGDFSLQRVLSKHTSIESPYNTYRNKGLPPGPIALPSIKAIDAVLNYQKHNYLYFCAKSDFSGQHAFAKTLVQHNQKCQTFPE